MIRLGSSTRTACATARLGAAGRRRALTTATRSSTNEGSRQSQAFAAGAVLAGAATTAYLLNKIPTVHNDTPSAPGVDITGPTGTAPPKLSDDGKLHTFVWGSNK
jgi:transcription elongation factor